MELLLCLFGCILVNWEKLWLSQIQFSQRFQVIDCKFFKELLTNDVRYGVICFNVMSVELYDSIFGFFILYIVSDVLLKSSCHTPSMLVPQVLPNNWTCSLFLEFGFQSLSPSSPFLIYYYNSLLHCFRMAFPHLLLVFFSKVPSFNHVNRMLQPLHLLPFHVALIQSR